MFAFLAPGLDLLTRLHGFVNIADTENDLVSIKKGERLVRPVVPSRPSTQCLENQT